MNKKISLYGAGGHGKVVADIVNDMGHEVKCVFDNNPGSDLLVGIPVKEAVNISRNDTPVIITIGNNGVRKKISEEIDRKEIEYASAVHPSALVAENVVIGEGSVVCHGAIIQAGAVIGRHCIINSGAIIEHDCVIGDFAHISPGAVVCGMVSVGEGTWIGAGAVVIQCLKIGKWSVVGAGSVVLKDVDDRVLVAGNPVKEIKRLI